MVLPQRTDQERPRPFGQVCSAGSVAATGTSPSAVLYHFHKLGLASGGFGVQMSQDIDRGFQGGAGQGRTPSRFGHGVASCNYEPAKEMKATRSAKTVCWHWEMGADSFISSQIPQAIYSLAAGQSFYHLNDSGVNGSTL